MTGLCNVSNLRLLRMRRKCLSPLLNSAMTPNRWSLRRRSKRKSVYMHLQKDMAFNRDQMQYARQMLTLRACCLKFHRHRISAK